MDTRSGRLEQMGVPKGDWSGTHAAPRLRWTWPDDLALLPLDQPTTDRVGLPVAAPSRSRTGSATVRPVDHPSSDVVVSDGPTSSERRRWACHHGVTVGQRGRLAPEVKGRVECHPPRPTVRSMSP